MELADESPRLVVTRSMSALQVAAPLQRVSRRCAPVLDAASAQLTPLLEPTHLLRHWHHYTLSMCGSVVVGVALLNSPSFADFVRRSALGLRVSLLSFWREHVWAPGRLIWRELVHRQYLQVSDPQQLSDADALLRSLVREFHETWGAQLDAVAAEAAADAAAAQAAAAAAAGAALPISVRAAAAGADAAGLRRRDSGAAGITEAASRAAAAAAAAVVSPLARVLNASLGMPMGAAANLGNAEERGIANLGTMTENEIEGSMAAMSALFAQQMASPAYNMLQVGWHLMASACACASVRVPVYTTDRL